MAEPVEKTLRAQFVDRFDYKVRMRRSTSRVWSTTEIRTLRELANAGASTQVIAAKLQRTPSAVRNKASFHGISVHSAPVAELVE
jgi:hypothetical protein